MYRKTIKKRNSNQDLDIEGGGYYGKKSADVHVSTSTSTGHGHAKGNNKKQPTQKELARHKFVERAELALHPKAAASHYEYDTTDVVIEVTNPMHTEDVQFIEMK